jgi:hypothetical protein
VVAAGPERELCTTGYHLEEDSAMLAGVLAGAVVLTVVVLAYVTDVLAARERVEVWRLARADRPRGAHERGRRSSRP